GLGCWSGHGDLLPLRRRRDGLLLRSRRLLGDERAVDVVGEADAARLGERLGVFLGEERAPYAARAAAAERAIAVDPGEHVGEHRVDEHRLEVLRGRARLGMRILGGGRCGRQPAERAGGAGRDRGERGRRHHITSMSAWMAPPALIACRRAIMSRGPMPRALRPSTSCCSDMPSFTSASFLPSSVTPTRERGTTTVRPRASGAGWLTCGDSEMVTVRLPWATATVETRTSRPITMMPERSSMMILPARSGSICNCSISVSSETTLLGYFFGTLICTVAGSSGSATGPPRKSLIAAAMRLAVVKSGLRSASRTWLRRLSTNSISRSMIAPLAMRPTVGTPRVIFAASP